MATIVTSLEGLDAWDRADLGESSWHVVDGTSVAKFEKAIGSGPECAIARPCLALALIPTLLEEVLRLTDARMFINYGVDDLRFPDILQVGDHVKLRARTVSTRRTHQGVVIKLAMSLHRKSPEGVVLAGDVIVLASSDVPGTTGTDPSN